MHKFWSLELQVSSLGVFDEVSVSSRNFNQVSVSELTVSTTSLQCQTHLCGVHNDNDIYTSIQQKLQHMTESTPLWQSHVAYSYTWKRFQNRCEWSTCFHGEFSLWCSNSKVFCERPLHCNVGNVKKINKISMFLSWKNFCGRQWLLSPFQQAFTYGKIKLG